MGKAKVVEAIVDPTAWMIDNDIADFLLVHQTSVLYMCMLGYTFLHGEFSVYRTRPLRRACPHQHRRLSLFRHLHHFQKSRYTFQFPLFFSSYSSSFYSRQQSIAAAPKDASFSYKFVSMILACTGGGILVPLFINKIPVPIANDAYPIAILISFSIHYYFPIVWQVVTLVPWVKAGIIVLYECVRAKVVLTFTLAANAAIAPSLLSFPLFGPIMCGTISGCGGAFLPMNKGLDPILKGMGYPMITACLGSTLVHLFMNTSMSEGVIDKKEKAHLHLVLMFILVGLVNGLGLKAKVKQA